MSYTHYLLTVSTNDNDYANEVADIFRERGQTCVVDERFVGINKKLDAAENSEDCDFIHIISIVSHENNLIHTRNNRNKKFVGDNYITDFLHNLSCNKLKYKNKAY